MWLCVPKIIKEKIISKMGIKEKKEKKECCYKSTNIDMDSPKLAPPNAASEIVETTLMWAPNDKLKLCIPHGLTSEDSLAHYFDGKVIAVPSQKNTTKNKIVHEKEWWIQAVQVVCRRTHLVVLKCFVEVEDIAQNLKDNFKGRPIRVYFCMKLRYPLSEVQEEINRYAAINNTSEATGSAERMHSNVKVSDLFPEIYGFMEFDMPKNEKWGAICMEFYEASVVETLYNNYHHGKSDLIKKMNLAYVSRCDDQRKNDDIRRNKGVLHFDNRFSSTCESKGICIKGFPGKSIYTSIVEACIQLLRCLHSFGWIHGDTHLGNFMIDASSLRIVLIDTERSFKSDCPVQKLLDVQEMFGHAISLTVSMPYNKTWDMREIQGVAGILHPFNSLASKRASTTATQTCMVDIDTEKMHSPIEEVISFELSPIFKQMSRKVPCKYRFNNSKQSLVFMMLPVCTCFTRHDVAERTRGCIYCQSKFNKRTANLLYGLSRRGVSSMHSVFDIVLNQFVKSSLSTIQLYIQCTRHVIRVNSTHARNHLIDTKTVWIHVLPSKIGKDDVSFSDFQCEKDMDMYDLYVQRLLYLGSFDPSSIMLTRKFIGFMEVKKLSNVARDFKNITLPRFTDNQLYEFIAHYDSWDESGDFAAHVFESCAVIDPKLVTMQCERKETDESMEVEQDEMDMMSPSEKRRKLSSSGIDHSMTKDEASVVSSSSSSSTSSVSSCLSSTGIVSCIGEGETMEKMSKRSRRSIEPHESLNGPPEISGDPAVAMPIPLSVSFRYLPGKE